MRDQELAREILGSMRRSLQLIQRRFAFISTPLDFVSSAEAVERLLAELAE